LIKRVLFGVAAGVVVGVVVFVALSLMPMGEGSYRYARKWKQNLSTCTSVEEVKRRFNCSEAVPPEEVGWGIGPGTNEWKKGRDKVELLVCTNGEWIVCASAGSHNNPWGGTIVSHDSRGQTRIFFGHVCLSAWPTGYTLEEAYSNLMSNFGRKEVFLSEE
jgi:hypothetical protein